MKKIANSLLRTTSGGGVLPVHFDPFYLHQKGVSFHYRKNGMFVAQLADAKPFGGTIYVEYIPLTKV